MNKEVIDAYLGPVQEQTMQRYAAYSEQLLEALTGECTTKEVKPGVWEHTFTPPIWSDALVRSLTTSLKFAYLFPVYSERQRAQRIRYKRTRRQHRAAFRRRKRGLA